MTSPPSSPVPAAAPPPPTTAPSTIKDGAVSGALPAAEAFAVHFPGYPSSPARAARSLGGLPAIAKVRSSDPGARLELRFRPEDPYCHPAFGEPRASAGLVLRLSRPKGEAPSPRRALRWSRASGTPTTSKMDVGPTLALPFNIQAVPGKINWEDHISKNSAEWDWQMAVCKVFDERPVWPRQSLYERLLEDGVQVSQGQFKRLLFRAGYYFSTGPFGKFWIRRGYDPRKDAESRISEKWTEMCKLEGMPSKSFIFLQLFELKDDFIQAEIRKPSQQSTCSHSTGWFSKPMIKTLRLQLSIRFLSLCPNEDAKTLLRNAHELIERSKKQEALCRSEQLKESKGVDEEAPAKHTGTEDQVGPNNSDSEDVDDEEEEDKEVSDGYDSPPMAEDVRDFTLDDSYTLGEGFYNGYLEEVLRSFPLHEDGQNNDAPNNAEASDGEFEIYEQPSDDEEYSDG